MTNESDIWVALGDPSRRAIVERLALGPLAVGELAAELPISRPAVSQHLKVLKDAGLVIPRAVGTRRIYELDPERLRELRAALEQFWSKALGSFKEIVEEPPEEKS